MLSLLEALKIYGNLMPRKFSKAIEKDLLSYRVKADEGIVCVYAFDKIKSLLFPYFYQKEPKTPSKEFEKARKIL